jgi:hypothetical protein
MFKYPCSYLIYSSAFDGLTDELRSEVVTQLLDVLRGREESPIYAHLTPTMRREILEILRDTKPGFEIQTTASVKDSHDEKRTASIE